MHDSGTGATILPVDGGGGFRVRRIYCVGRNYADHVREMGGAVERSEPVFFMKPADALLCDGEPFPYPPNSQNVHHEVELVLALGRGGANLDEAAAHDCIAGYAVGNDWTRRDLQAAAKRAGAPWDMAKGFDHSAAVGPLRLVERAGHCLNGAISLTVNGAPRQQAQLTDMLLPPATLVAALSRYVTLATGDLIYTGTPAGVGAVAVGDRVVCAIDGLPTLSNEVVERA